MRLDTSSVLPNKYIWLDSHGLILGILDFILNLFVVLSSSEFHFEKHPN